MPTMMHVYEVRPRRDHRGVDLISDALPFGRLWYDTPDNAIGYAMHSSRSHDAVIRVYDAAGNEHKGDFKERCASLPTRRAFRQTTLYGGKNRLQSCNLISR
jgi:hypothetical protein